ncbi:ATP-binding protein [Arabiibacter massiliensis]|uniref:ATP-binding protein n=1 Tax=Arabiibacter massiliensis TaxID=1870985 RepID=UPI0009BAA0DF|nr:AAA family ATPase [Arabiibacter massiliensis]
MKRKIDAKLRAWKESATRKPLVISGARQVGKTYSVLAFARQEFASTLYIDFSAQKNMCALFDGDITPETLLPQLEAVGKKEIDPRSTLIFFDEIQACPRALTSLKYFCERAPQYCVVAAGSLLGVALGRDEYSFPVGKVDQLPLHPLDFEEFLWAAGEERLAGLIRGAYREDALLGLHDEALARYREYVLVGGLPEAVRSYVEEFSLLAVRAIQQGIADAYLADMTKYASPLDSAKILNVWRSVPEQLAKENHKFQYATIASSARAFQYEAPINWLHAAGLVSFCYRVSEGKKPLKAYTKHDFFKLYLLDVGLLSTLQGLDAEDLAPASDKGSRFRGGVAENYVMQQFLAAGLEPFYWGTASKSEVDFVVQLEGGAVPVEVKSGGNVSARSLESYRRKYQPSLAIRLSTKNFGFANGIKSVPLYAAFCVGS